MAWNNTMNLSTTCNDRVFSFLPNYTFKYVSIAAATIFRVYSSYSYPLGVYSQSSYMCFYSFDQSRTESRVTRNDQARSWQSKQSSHQHVSIFSLEVLRVCIVVILEQISLFCFILLIWFHNDFSSRKRSCRTERALWVVRFEQWRCVALMHWKSSNRAPRLIVLG
jgi:hypothetical protein